MTIVGVGDNHTSAKVELLRAHGCPIPILADKILVERVAFPCVGVLPRMYMEDIGDCGIRVDCEHPSTCTAQLLCLDQVLHAAVGQCRNS